MDTGLGTCDAYIRLRVAEYHFRSRVVRNSLDPDFRQSFRIRANPRNEPAQLLRLELFDWDRYVSSVVSTIPIPHSICILVRFQS